MKIIAIEEHFTTPMYRQKVGANEFRNFYLTSRSEQIGHDIVEELADLGAGRLARMDAAGIDVQVLSVRLARTAGIRRGHARSRWRATPTTGCTRR